MDLSSLDWVKYAAGMGCDVCATTSARRDALGTSNPHDIMLTQAASLLPYPWPPICNKKNTNYKKTPTKVHN